MPSDPPPPVLLARDLVAEGYRYSDLTTLARSGGLQHLRRGAYTRVAADLDEVGRHGQLIAATVPLLAAAEIAVVHGLPVTSLARTVVDLGRTLPFADAVAAADAALRQGLSPIDLEQAVAWAAGRPGVAGARRVAAFADARSESAGESHSRVVLQAISLPPSSLQHRVLDGRGREIARCDFGWESHRTVGEFDGRVKYGRLVEAGQTPADVVYAEKRREDAVRDAGWQVVRWSWADLRRDQLLAEQLRRAFRRGNR